MANFQDTAKTTVIVDGKQGINELGKLEMEANEYKKALEGMRKGTSAYVNTSKKLTDTKKRITELRQELGTAGMTMRQLRNHARDLQRQVDTTVDRSTKEYKKLKSELIQVNKVIRHQRMEVRGLTGVWHNLGRSFKQSLSLFGPSALITTGIYTLISGIRSFVTTFKNFQEINSELAGILRVATKETVALQAQQLRLGKTTEFTARQVAQAQIELARLGQEEQNIIKMTPGILAAATAMKVSLAEAAELVAGQLNAFNLQAEESTRVADVLSKSTQISAFNFERLKTALAIVSPAAKASNVSLEQTLAILSAAIDANVDASSAGTALRNIFIDIADKGLSLNDALAKIKNSQDKLTTANELFGKRGAVVSAIIAENTDKILANTAALNDAKGTAQEFADKQLDNLTGDIKLLNSAWEGLLLTVEKGDGVIAGALRGTVQMATEAVTAITNLDLVFSTMFDSFDRLSDNEILKLMDAGMQTDSGKSVLSFFKKLEDIPMDKIIANTEKYKKVVVDALVSEGETLEQSSRIFDVWYASKEKGYEIAIKSQESYDHALNKGIDSFDKFQEKYGENFKHIKFGQEKLIEIEKLYQKAIEDRQNAQSGQTSPRGPQQASDPAEEDLDWSWIDDGEELLDVMVDDWDNLWLQLKHGKGEFYESLNEQTLEFEEAFTDSFDAMMDKDLEATLSFLENLKIKDEAIKKQKKENLRDFQSLGASAGEIFGALASLQSDATEHGIRSAARLANAQVVASNVAVLAEQASALATAIKAGTVAGATAGPAAPLAIPAAIAAIVGTVMSAFASIRANSMQADAQIEQLGSQKKETASPRSYYHGNLDAPETYTGMRDAYGPLVGSAAGGMYHPQEGLIPAYIRHDPESINAEAILAAKAAGYSLDRSAQGGSMSHNISLDVQKLDAAVDKLGAFINVLIQKGIPSYFTPREHERANDYQAKKTNTRDRGALS
ncbi:phage tail tape measure protein [Marinoscillum furvescens]|uniref:TP901 family phage tail tape measure protein n=1 Tax=Marinoscillum furvescens DSM 4134 TaxID=1122208 RepID=A0A3D9L500_MARFU|nr:phage tail tape measure protein [Marinoscillum furvescens]REE01105.1 TP901 family phage tail tape measure protein [Marinoscillum furvescens DSM 4134]